MERYKWPSTPYITDLSPEELYDRFDGRHVIVTEKLDGENTTMTNEFIHARSLDSKPHPSRDYVRGMWGAIRYRIPTGLYIVGENVYAKHSIFYPEISSPFYVFAMYEHKIGKGLELYSWSRTVKMAKQLGLFTVPVLGEAITGVKHMDLWKKGPSKYGPEREGFVVRPECEFPLKDWEKRTAKWVRPNHVQTDAHWMYRPIVRNGIKEEE